MSDNEAAQSSLLLKARFAHLWCGASLAALLVCTVPSFGADLTWKANPVSGQYNGGANWEPGGIPGVNDTAIFGASSISQISFSGTTANVNGWRFLADAEDYVFENAGHQLVFNAAGIQVLGGSVTINNRSAGNNEGIVIFRGDSTAATATINNFDFINGRSYVYFYDNATAGNSTINNDGWMNFNDSSKAGLSRIINSGSTSFRGVSSAENAEISNSRTLNFTDTSSAEAAKILSSGNLYFDGSARGGSSEVTNSGRILFVGHADPEDMRIVNQGGVIDIALLANEVSFRHLHGDGEIYLGGVRLVLGEDDSDALLSAVISDCGPTGDECYVRYQLHSVPPAGKLLKAGNGTLTLAGANTYRGETTVSSGVLQLGNGGATGSVAGDIRVDAGLIFNRNNDYTFSGILSGSGHLTQAGSGTTQLTGDSSAFSGQMAVTGGRLIVGNAAGAGALGGTVLVQSGGALGGSGTVGTAGTTVTIANGGILAPGNSIGTMTVAGNLVLNPGAQLHFEIGAPGNPGASDHVNVAGNLTLGGTLNLSDADGSAIGHYRLMTYGGSLSGNAQSISVAAPFAGTTTVELNDNHVDILVADANSGVENPNLQYWQDNALPWNTAGVNWRNQNGTTQVSWAGNHGVFGRPNEPQGPTVPGVPIVVEGTQNFKGLQFVADGYELTGAGNCAPTTGGASFVCWAALMPP